MPAQEKIDQFKEAMRGSVIAAGDPAYEEARKVYNGMIDKRPRWIARCVDAADIMTGVRFARENDVLLAIRGGGHNGPGLGSCDDGLVLDLSPMKGVRVDPASKTVRAEPGCTQGDVDHATHAFGLAVPAGVVSTTGLAGLTLGGGTGYLTRKHGLTIDNLLEADLVLADGRFVTASEKENEDLFWAIRGGGGNFGVVTSFRFQAHPVSHVYGGLTFFDVEQAETVLKWYREYLPAAPEEVCCIYGMKRVPPAPPFPEEIHGRRIAALIWCSTEPEEKAQKLMEPLKDLPQPLFNHLGTMPFPMLQAMFDPLLPKGLQWYWKGDFFREVSDEAVAAHVEHGSKTPSGLSLMHLYPIDGAVRRVDAGATAWSTRDATWNMVIAGIDPDPGKAEELKTWARGYWDSLHAHSAGSAYINFMMEEGDERIQATYGPNYERLRAVKAKYDPDNLFRVNQNIKPAAR